MRFPNDKFDAESLLKKIDSLKPIRDIYFDFLIATINSGYFSSDFVKNFLEELYNRVPNSVKNGYCESNFEYYDFFIWETFIGTIAILWKHEQYSAIYDLIHKKYFLRESLFPNSGEKACSFLKFRKYFTCVEEDCQKDFEQKYFSYASKLLTDREKLPYLSKTDFCETDLRLYHLSTIILETRNEIFWNVRFPSMYYYVPSSKNIWQKLISKSYCEKILHLFGVKTISELQALFNNFNKKQFEPVDYKSRFCDRAPNILDYVRNINIASLA